MSNDKKKSIKPKVSIVMPLYNKGGEINRAITSVLNQTCQDFELIVINDGSTDNGPDIVREIRDKRIKIIDQENKGVSAARNRGIEEAITELVTFLDADDEWIPDFLETIFRLYQKFPDCSVFSTNYIRYDATRDVSTTPIIKGLDDLGNEGEIYNYFGVASKSDPLLTSSSIAVKKESLKAVGCFPEDIKYGEDLLTWARLAIKYRIAYSKKPSAVFWIPYDVGDRPGRHNDRSDNVGRELVELLEGSPADKARYVRKYISLWERMRAAIYLKHGDRESARKAISEAIEVNGLDFRLIIYGFLSVLPGFLFVILNELFCALKLFRRKLGNGQRVA